MKNFFKILLLFSLSIVTISCEDDNESNLCCAGSSVVDLSSQNENLSTLVSALQLTGLEDVLSSPGSFTVLAPSNEAFDSFLNSIDATSLEDIPLDILSNVLLNHVIVGRFESSMLSNGYASSLAVSSASDSNMSIYVNVDNGVKFNGTSTVTSADIIASNGVVHIVDQVIGLPTIVTFSLADPNFENLVQALTREDLTQPFVELLSTPMGSAPAPLTVFAPVNNAFQNLIEELEVASLNDIAEPTLSAVLTYHVLGGLNQRSSNLFNGTVLTTLLDQNAPGEGNLTFNFADNGQGMLTDNNGRTSNIVVVDVQANNGIIHAIDTVVLP
tara:strand:- start:83 stop:1069 length:987 start_codon:yes stop_codon:yes gene_type:complete